MSVSLERKREKLLLVMKMVLKGRRLFPIVLFVATVDLSTPPSAPDLPIGLQEGRLAAPPSPVKPRAWLRGSRVLFRGALRFKWRNTKAFKCRIKVAAEDVCFNGGKWNRGRRATQSRRERRERRGRGEEKEEKLSGHGAGFFFFFTFFFFPTKDSGRSRL